MFEDWRETYIAEWIRGVLIAKIEGVMCLKALRQ